MSVNSSSSELLVASKYWRRLSPSLNFCSPDIRRDWGVIFLKYPSRLRNRCTG